MKLKISILFIILGGLLLGFAQENEAITSEEFYYTDFVADENGNHYLPAVRRFDVALDHVDKVGRNIRTRQELHSLAINEDRSTRFFASTR